MDRARVSLRFSAMDSRLGIPMAEISPMAEIVHAQVWLSLGIVTFVGESDLYGGRESVTKSCCASELVCCAAN